MAVVSDSEIPVPVIDALDGRPEITISSRVAQTGWRIEQLDPGLDAALKTPPDVLLYSGGANDLEPLGISGMLDALKIRLDRAKAATCVVFISPAVDTAQMDEATRAQTDQLLAAFGDVVGGWGMRIVSYPKLAAAMAAEGGYFFSVGELGSFHPGPVAYGRITDAIAREIAACP